MRRKDNTIVADSHYAPGTHKARSYIKPKMVLIATLSMRLHRHFEEHINNQILHIFKAASTLGDGKQPYELGQAI
ncbi:predicted protein [Sclerotinia sclerotiorum 1980 UF-70]|uniref:Uncharacterized protein n=2 Tax=Sclerotinia sclerotiorum (strain ATCC 18683 / 1980 / Ss-1) TaxID=665079 RepID=A7F179_SCLS1|nr:predicted protein [Sclerotinia sclerotiorum 1980 UF-70]APA11158.1 hypothetical protein sscle_07g059280 [Sclerotinia sclerotiorum 1980 UF-70]EDN95471.1 predicted protein [Sclerotinia sclerotiorum 1980 UF-70]